jgi:uncharacterized spore protein YtfJ
MDTEDRFATIAHEVATALEREGNVRAVFGEPMKLETRVMVPVATVAMGGGGGGVRALGVAVDTVRRWLIPRPVHVSPTRTSGVGVGGGLDVRPVGFIWEDSGRIVFTPIDDLKHRPRTT